MRHILPGLLIGVACILPGASGGVLAVAFGLYRPMLEALNSLFRSPQRSLRLLAPLGAGIACGIILGALCLSGAMAHHQRLMLFLFTGLIIGGIPDLMLEAQKNEPFRWRWLLATAGGVLMALPLCILGAPGAHRQSLSPMAAFVCGILEGVGTVVPGVSTSFVLIRLGWYQAYLRLFSVIDIRLLLSAAAGFGLSCRLCLRGVQRLFDRHAGYAFYGVLGFVLVSVALVFPGFSHGVLFWAEGALLTAGITTVRWMGKLKSGEE